MDLGPKRHRSIIREGREKLSSKREIKRAQGRWNKLGALILSLYIKVRKSSYLWDMGRKPTNVPTNLT